MRNIIIIRDNVAVFVPIAPGRRFVSATTSSAALCQSKQRSSVDKQSLSQPFSIATIKRSKDPKIQRLQRSKDSRTASTSLSPPPSLPPFLQLFNQIDQIPNCIHLFHSTVDFKASKADCRFVSFRGLKSSRSGYHGASDIARVVQRSQSVEKK